MSTMCIYQHANHIPSMSVPNINMYHHLYQASTSTMNQYHNKMDYNQYVSSCMYAKSTIKHMPINLLVGASTNVLGVYQSCINYDSSMLYNMITSSTHQLHVPICSSSICQMHASRYPTSKLPIIHHNETQICISYTHQQISLNLQSLQQVY